MSEHHRFECHWPLEFTGGARIDFARLTGASVKPHRSGELAIHLPEPFDDLVIVNGETLTVEKAKRLCEIAKVFGKSIIEKGVPRG